jgi:dephospho-CoA kinase
VIIGLSGYAQSGKDEVAKILVSEYGFTRVAFADKIRELLYEMNPDFRDTLLQQAVDRLGWDEVKKDQAVRRMMQNLGVGARKMFGDGFWVAQVFNGYDWDIPTVVTDVRFQNEAELLKKWTPDDTQIWRVKRPGVEAVNGHISEHDLDDYKFDQILKNEGTLEDLTNMVRRRMEFTLNAN